MYRKLQVSGLSEIVSFTCISATWDQHPASWFLTSPCPQFLSAHWGGARGISQLLHRRHCSPFSGGGGGGTSRIINSYLEASNLWWLWHSSLLTWQELLHFTDISLANSLKYCLFNEVNLDTLSSIATLPPLLHPAHVSLFYSTFHTHTQFSYLSFLYCLFSIGNVVPQKQGFVSV